MSHGHSWSEGEVAMLRTLWAEGLTASDIAKRMRQLGLCLTRNAVISKVHRLGLPRRRINIPEEVRIRRVRIAREKALPKPPKLPPEPIPPRARRPPASSSGLMTWTEHVDFRDCAMFCADESGVHGKVCGRSCAPELAYCPSCARVAFMPAPLAKQKRAA